MIGWLLIAALLVAIVIERIAKPTRFRTKDTVVNVWTFMGYLAISLVWGPLLFELYSFVHDHALFDFGPHWLDIGSPRYWAAWLSLFILDDFTFYWFHRCSHRFGLLWAGHVTHHSSQQFNLSVGLRQTWAPFVAAPFWLWLCWLGFDPLMVMSMEFMSLMYQSLLHTQGVGRLGAFGYVLNAPGHHQLHHGDNDVYRDKNFGGVLIIWDRLFGTFVGPTEAPHFGIGRRVDHPFVGLHGWLDLLPFKPKPTLETNP
jgi:sterol desaturase/sphingolipid hydroxylase (fatty acid hydroxylase superfamily)